MVVESKATRRSEYGQRAAAPARLTALVTALAVATALAWPGSSNAEDGDEWPSLFDIVVTPPPAMQIAVPIEVTNLVRSANVVLVQCYLSAGAAGSGLLDEVTGLPDESYPVVGAGTVVLHQEDVDFARWRQFFDPRRNPLASGLHVEVFGGNRIVKTVMVPIATVDETVSIETWVNGWCDIEIYDGLPNQPLQRIDGQSGVVRGSPSLCNGNGLRDHLEECVWPGSTPKAVIIFTRDGLGD